MTTKEETIKSDTVETVAVEKTAPFAPAQNQGGYKGKKRTFGPRTGGKRTFADRPKPEFDQKIISIRRVTRVVAGGRRFSFSVAIVLGDRKGSVGVGTGKANDTSLAIEKASRSAKKNMIKVSLKKDMTIPHNVEAKYSSSRVMLMPNNDKGLVVGSSVRNVVDLAGIKNISAKVLSGSKNKLNNARATVDALSKLTKNIKERTVKE